MFGGLFGGSKKAEAKPAVPATANGKSPSPKKADKPKVASAESSDSTIVKLDENGNPIEEEEEEEPLYVPDAMHVYGQDGGALHPDDRQNPNPERQAQKEDKKTELAELSAKERKERHSADAKSSVNRTQGQKKGGHGGGHSWLGANDNDIPEGYVPSSATDKMGDVTMGVANNQNNALLQDDFNMKKQTSKDFPSLGNAPPKSPLRQHQENTWKQAVADDPKITV